MPVNIRRSEELRRHDATGLRLVRYWVELPTGGLTIHYGLQGAGLPDNFRPADPTSRPAAEKSFEAAVIWLGTKRPKP